MMDEKDFNHKIQIKVRFSDLDAMRHVNNAAYLSYLEEARISYFNDVLNTPKDSLNFGVVIARIEIDYIWPIMLGDELEILTRVTKLGNKSSDVEHLIVIKRDSGNIKAAAALTKLVSFDYQKQISIPIPEDIKEVIRKFEGAAL